MPFADSAIRIDQPRLARAPRFAWRVAMTALLPRFSRYLFSDP